MKIFKLLIILTPLLIISCSDDEFSAKKISESPELNQIVHFKDQRCATGVSKISPKVDFLFLWDNSGSQVFITPETKNALTSLINTVSNDFDYRMLLAPLLPGATDPRYLVASTTKDLKPYGKSILIPSDSAASMLGTFPTTTLGSKEDGLNRVLSILNANTKATTGIFREGAYTMVVIMSNGDDNSFVPNGFTQTEALSKQYAGEKHLEFINLKSNVLHSAMFRFFSLVGHNLCTEVPRINVVYKTMSGYMYSSSGATDQTGSYPDSYDICGANFNGLFGGINESLIAQTIKHVYNYWPVTDNINLNFDSSKIKVTKNGVNIPRSSTNGFTYVGIQTNRNTQFSPTPDPNVTDSGAPFTGHMIQLHGTAMVTFPECMIVETETPAEYFGYIQFGSKPKIDTIYITIDGRVIPQSTTNGWEYIGHVATQNIKILDPAHPDSPGVPPNNKSGYFLKMHGDAIYTNNSTVEIKYTPGT